MNRIYLISTILLFTFGCGDYKLPNEPISLTDSVANDSFCLQLDRAINFQFQTLDSLNEPTVETDSALKYLYETNEQIVELLSSMIKGNEFHFCHLIDSTNISCAISFDKKLALFSWDTRLGGTMRAFTSCAIYKTENKFKVKWLNNLLHDTTTQFSELNYVSYSDIYSTTMKNGKTIYLPYGSGLSETQSPWRTIKAFLISNDLEYLKIFPEGKSELFCEYDFTCLNPSNLPDSVIEIRFSEKENKLEIPIVEHGRPNGEYETLTFDGKLFRKLAIAKP